MANFNALPVEILRNIIRKIPGRPFKTKLLLLNKSLCRLFMTEQIRRLDLKYFQLRIFVEIIKDNDIEELYSVPQYNSLLDSIHEINTNVYEAGFFMNKLAGFIHRCKNLRRLALDLPDFSPNEEEFDSDISNVFNGLSLSIVEMEFRTMWFRGAVQALTEYVRRSKKLTKLCFTGGYFCAENIYILAECLKQNTLITDLDLSYNFFSTDDISTLAESLKLNTVLINLDLSFNSIDAEGACALATCVELNTSITNLYLGGNGIGSKGVCALVESLKRNTTLTSLDLFHNGIDDNDCHSLSESLRQNRTLTHLSLQCNQITDEGAYTLMEGLRQKETLFKLYLRFNPIANQDDLIKSLEPNTTLTIDFDFFPEKYW